MAAFKHDSPTASDSKYRFKLSLSTRIVLAMIGGTGVGLFFGEPCDMLRPFGNAFIGLLQMTVIPFIFCSLVTNIARLDTAHGKRLAVAGLLTVLVLWAVGLVLVTALTCTFPTMQSASFYRHDLIAESVQTELLPMFIPSNPFESLASGAIPAIVLFALVIGAALARIPDNDQIVAPFRVLTAVMMRVNAYVVRLSPVGIFVITAANAGTLDWESVGRLQVYIVSYVVGILFASIWLIPMLISACTPFSYRVVLRMSREAMLTAFATGKTMTVLPILIQRTSELLDEYQMQSSPKVPPADALYALGYPFPSLGHILTLLFIPFVAWFVGSPMSPDQLLQLFPIGVLTNFGKPVVAIPFLLDVFRLPADSFELFLLSGVYVARFGDVLATMHLVAFSLIVATATSGRIRIEWRRALQVLCASVVIGVLAISSARWFLAATFVGAYERSDHLAEMQLLLNHGPAKKASPDDLTEVRPGETAWERIIRTRRLRVGYQPDQRPYSYTNSRGALVGLDIDQMLLLADELGIQVRFVPCVRERLKKDLDAGVFDVAVSGLPVTTPELARMRFTTPYLNVSWALLVPDHRRHEFATMHQIHQLEHLTIGVPSGDYFRNKLGNLIPRATFVEVDSPQDYFEGRHPELDAMLYGAEGGAAWTIEYPSFQVVVPQGVVRRQPIAFAVGRAHEDLADFLSNWIQLKKSSGEFDQLYDHWILGRDSTLKPPRWSVLRDVLGWGE